MVQQLKKGVLYYKRNTGVTYTLRGNFPRRIAKSQAEKSLSGSTNAMLIHIDNPDVDYSNVEWKTMINYYHLDKFGFHVILTD